MFLFERPCSRTGLCVKEVKEKTIAVQVTGEHEVSDRHKSGMSSLWTEGTSYPDDTRRQSDNDVEGIAVGSFNGVSPQ